MTVSEEDIIRDQNERNGLQRAIADAETAIAVSAPGTRRTLENFVEQARGRITTLDKKINDAKEARENEVRTQAAVIAALAVEETALSESEKQTYSGFLAKEFFTKKDFGKLEDFYAHTWDHLSDGGKDEMSHRFWKGIERGEYSFGDAPAIIQQKEAVQVNRHLGRKDVDAADLAKLPQEDQRAFAHAFENDKDDDAAKILSRSHRKPSSEERPLSRESISAKEKSSDSQGRTSKTSPDAGSIDLKTLDLGGIQLQETDAVAKPAVAAVPNPTAQRRCEGPARKASVNLS